MNEERKSYVYRHRRLDTNEVFYVGFSEGNKENYQRAKTKFGRNPHWTRIVKIHGFNWEIIADNLSVDEAQELEIFVISLYGRLDKKEGLLVNMADGGEGNLGYMPSEKVRKEHSERMRGEGNPFYGKHHTEESITKLLNNRKTLKGEEHHNWGKIYTEEERNRMIGERPSVTGCKNPNAKELINIKTLEIFCSISEASKSIGILPSLLGANLNGKNINKTDFIF